MTANELCFAPAVELAAAIRARRLSPVELVEATLSRISQVDPALNAYCLVRAEEALDEARQAESLEAIGPLHGVPVSIKDMAPTKGIRTTYGSRAFEHYVPTEDAVLVERLKAAGAIVIGKTTTPELGNKGVCESPLFGRTCNPWDLSRTSGGSSGGAAVAVAAGMGPLAHGTDGAGSIRIPASFCGVVGMKPSFGRVPVFPRNGYESATHAGPIARTTGDIALMLSIISGSDERDPYGDPGGGTAFLEAAATADVRGWRIGYSPDFGMGPIDTTVRDVVTAAVTRFDELGAHVDEISVDLPDSSDAMLVMWRTAIATAAREQILPVIGRAGMDPHVVELMAAAEHITAFEYYGAAQLFRHTYRRAMLDLFADIRVLVTPTLKVPPFPHPLNSRPGPSRVAGVESNEFLGWLLTYPFNLTGQPAISVPCGFDADGLPIGLQIVGRPGADEDVIRAAAALESILRWPDVVPPDPGGN